MRFENDRLCEFTEYFSVGGAHTQFELLNFVTWTQKRLQQQFW